MTRMTNKVFFEIHSDLDRESPGRDKYTRQAFEMLPKLEKPHILDVGCGPGTPTILLAKMSGGDIVGIDTHQSYLDRLKRRAEKDGLSDRIEAINHSMLDMDFPDNHFDIIWAEGSIYNIGFEKGLKEWRRLIKNKGFLVVHEMAWLAEDPPKEIFDYWKAEYPGICTVDENLEIIPKCGYNSIGHFPLPEDAWWKGYYEPLQNRISMLRKKYMDDETTIKILNNEQEEIDMYKKYQKWYGSAFFIMQKSEQV